MDAHFNEYLAAASAMREMYGEAPEEHASDFHDRGLAATDMGVGRRTPVETAAVAEAA